MRRRGSSDLNRPIAIMAVAGWLAVTACTGGASGQTVYNPVATSYQIAPAGSLEYEILDRLAYTHRYDWRDLPRLARLTVLESIALYESMLSDLPLSMAGARIEGEMSVLWNSAEFFYVSLAPADAPSLVRSRPLLSDVEEAYGRVDAILRSLPGISQRASLHLNDLARLLPAINALIDAMEAEAAPAPAPVAPRLDPSVVREQARLLVDDLRGTAKALRDAKPGPAGREALIADLDSLIELVQGFDRALAVGGDALESLRLVRSRLWPIEARYLLVAGTPELVGRWRSIRQRMNAISDRFDRPRVIALKPSTAPAAGVDRKLLAQADRAVVALDEFLTKDPTAASAGASQYKGDLGELRRRLLLFRQLVAAGEPIEALSRSLREIEDLDRRLGERARSEGRIFRGGARVDARGLQAPSQAVERLRELMPKVAEGANRPAP